MRSRIGRRILAGYLAVSVLLACLLAASASAGSWVVHVARRVDQANRAAGRVLLALAVVERRLFTVLLRAADASAGPDEEQLLARVLSLQLERLSRDPDLFPDEARQEADRLRDVGSACGRTVQEFLVAPPQAARQPASVLACHRQLGSLLERRLERVRQVEEAAASQLQAVQRSAWLPGFLRNLARNTERAQRLGQAVLASLEFERRFWKRLSSTLLRAKDPQAPPATDGLRLLEEVERLAPSPEARAATSGLRAAASRVEAHLVRLAAPASMRAMVADAGQVVARLEALRPLLEVERDRALEEAEVVNQSVVSFVQTFSTAAVAALLVGFLVLLALTRSMTASLEALREAMERVRDGQLDVRVDVGRRRDETAEMARVFNHMVSELQESRQRLHAYQEELQRRVEERTRALQEAQAQLLQAEKLSAVGELVAGVAHELNNPLTSVLGYAQLLESDSALPDDLRSYAEVVVREADRARQIVHSLLTFARPQPVEREVLDLNEAVRQALEIPRWEWGQVQVVPRLHPEPLWVQANAVQLQQVFTNIVQNALQAMRGGPGSLFVTTGRAGDRAVVQFEDTGPGIPPEHLTRVFDPFFTTKKLGEGTGLGLSISFGIVRDHGGTIRARNRPEGGACFTVELPLSDPPAASP
ncbi:MAG: ATP-binding protein [Armatimonadota bacterium]|nr:ATP-binding protein [Armatimonadota bacterium]MDW8155003.1 ATP-binding protein [Armatimonadota bacterium]